MAGIEGAAAAAAAASQSKMSLSSNSSSGDSKIMNQFENYIIVDIGANLTNKKFSRDLDSVIQRAKEAGKNNMRT